jgi:acetoacetyl-CoA synthetase
VSSKSGTATVEALTQIWKKVLQRPSIGVGENFFDLTSDDALADVLFAEIAREFGRQFPSTSICYAQTVSALASLLNQPEFPKCSPLVLLRAGDNQQPIFIAPGVGGRASFSGLARQMQTDRAIYGIQAKGLDGLEQPFDRIEDMAEFYLKSIRQLQPQGPYFLIGYSFGGLLALEMAHRLTAAGQRLALLTLIDTYPHPRSLPFAERLRFIANRVKGSFNRRMNGSRDHNSVQPESSPLSFARNMQRVKESDFAALARYRPRFYRGAVNFIRPQTAPYLASDPFKVWANLVGELKIENVPGDHLGMVGAHPQNLAVVLSRQVRAASGE